MKRKPFRRVAAAAAAMAVALLGLVTPAHADVSAVTITENTGSLIVHKYEGPTVACERNGSDVSQCLTDAGAKPLPNAEFTVWQVTDVDLKTNDGWEAAKAYYAAGTKPTALGTPVVLSTGADGIATFSNLPVGLYYVEETAVPTGAEGATYTPAVPFFVTIPMTNPDRDAWMYDVHVFPKNLKSDKPHKAVIDVDSYKVGDEVPYRVSHTIPTYGNVVGAPETEGGPLTAPEEGGTPDRWDVGSYYIGDKFPAELENVSVTSVKIIKKDVDPTKYTEDDVLETLVAGTDYVVRQSGNLVNVSLIGTGLDKLAANGGNQIVVDYSTTIKSIPDSGLIENTAWVVPGPTPSQGGTPPTPPTSGTPPEEPPTTPEEPGTPTNTVVSKFGKIRIYKVGLDGTQASETPLGGVEFDIYKATAVADATKPGGYDYKCDDLTGQTSLGTITTDATGAGVSDMLALSTWYNDGVEKSEDPKGNNDGYLDGAQYATKHGFKNYCLVETKAHPEYELLAEPVLFSLTQEGATTNIALDQWQKVKNQKKNIGNNLPLTGGEGIAALSLGGLALIGGGVAYYAYTSRKRRQA